MALRLDRDQVKQLLKQGRIIATPDLLTELATGSDRSQQHNGRRAHPGRCEDLGFAPKSIWEQNYGYYLRWQKLMGQIQEWEYEPVVFKFEGITRGCTEYRPDFRIQEAVGKHWFAEVKGYFDQRSKTKLARMRRYYPKEEIRLVGREWFAEALRSGLAGAVPGWVFPEREA